MHKMFELASAESCWRGVDYYRKRKVISFEKVADVKQGGYYNPGEGCIYKGLVRGRSPSEDDGYNGSPGRPVLSPEEAKQYNKSDAPIYHVTINTLRPKKSTCDCEFAKGRYVICKHMVALFVTAEPEQLDRLYEEIENNQKAAEEREQQEKNARKKELERQAQAMSRSELEKAFVEKSIWLDEAWAELKEAYRGRWIR